MAKIKPSGFQTRDMAKLLSHTVGTAWIPTPSFNEIGNAEAVAIGGSTPVGVDFDPDTDEAIDVAWLVPKEMDVSKPLYAYVYWSTADATTTEYVMWAIDYLSVADGEAMGASFTTVAAAKDINLAQVDALQIAPVITIPASTCAVGDVLFLNLRRDANHTDDTVNTLAAAFGIKLVYSCLPSVMTAGSEYGEKVTKTGYLQKNLVELLDKSVGQLWVPIGDFHDIGNAEISAVIGSGLATGYLFDTGTDEAMSVNVMMPKNMDVTKAASIYVYWSSGVTTGTVCWDIDHSAIAVGEDAGKTIANIAGVADTVEGTANYLNVSAALSLPASTLASTDEVLSLSVRRDVAIDNLNGDAVLYGIRIDYTCKPSISISTGSADIKPEGVHQGDLVRLLEKSVGRMWIPDSKFSNVGATATAAAIGGTTPVAMGLRGAVGDEAIEIPILVPPEMDVTLAASITVYWSSVDAAGTATVNFDLDYIAIAAGEDIGATDGELAATQDICYGTADYLQTAEVITLPANTFASNAEILFLRLRRDQAADDSSDDASVYGVKIDYSCRPSIASA